MTSPLPTPALLAYSMPNSATLVPAQQPAPGRARTSSGYVGLLRTRLQTRLEDSGIAVSLVSRSSTLPMSPRMRTLHLASSIQHASFGVRTLSLDTTMDLPTRCCLRTLLVVRTAVSTTGLHTMLPCESSVFLCFCSLV